MKCSIVTADTSNIVHQTCPPLNSTLVLDIEGAAHRARIVQYVYVRHSASIANFFEMCRVDLIMNRSYRANM